jgi:hypothetical protein
MNLYLWTLAFEFHLIFTCHKMLLLFSFFPQPFENVKTILSFYRPYKNKQWINLALRHSLLTQLDPLPRHPGADPAVS